MRLFIPLFCLLFITACGSAEEIAFDPTISTQAPPFVARVSPTSGQVGDTVTLFGFGFSNAVAANAITLGGASAKAATYALVDPVVGAEIEKITFAVPSGATAGATTVFVTVFDETSNNDVSFTVNP